MAWIIAHKPSRIFVGGRGGRRPCRCRELVLHADCKSPRSTTFPLGVDGAGECIALIELGGGYNPTDLSSYWSQLNLTETPTVSAVSVGNGSNNPTGDPNGPDGEVMLDIEVSGSIAPGAKIVVYFAENTDAGFLNAITTAVHDSTNNPSVVSISWGGPESSWTQQAMTSMDEAFQSAAAMGVTVCVAAGDDGSTDGVTDGLNHVDFPASSPNVLACGGTELVASGNNITSETVWNELANNEGATGGGISDVFPLPSWQNGAGVPPSANPNQQCWSRRSGCGRRCRSDHWLRYSRRWAIPT